MTQANAVGRVMIPPQFQVCHLNDKTFNLGLDQLIETLEHCFAYERVELRGLLLHVRSDGNSRPAQA